MFGDDAMVRDIDRQLSKRKELHVRTIRLFARESSGAFYRHNNVGVGGGVFYQMTQHLDTDPVFVVKEDVYLIDSNPYQAWFDFVVVDHKFPAFHMSASAVFEHFNACLHDSLDDVGAVVDGGVVHKSDVLHEPGDVRCCSGGTFAPVTASKFDSRFLSCASRCMSFEHSRKSHSS